MSEKKDTTESLKLEDAQIERLQISLKQKMHNCPRCKDETNHDDRFKTVKDLSISWQVSVLYPHGKPSALPWMLSFDELKGNANGERFQCILTASEEQRILDILQDVQYVVIDMD